jgi:hypothetical protein
MPKKPSITILLLQLLWYNRISKIEILHTVIKLKLHFQQCIVNAIFQPNLTWKSPDKNVTDIAIPTLIGSAKWSWSVMTSVGVIVG